jgi:hypothetical protein
MIIKKIMVIKEMFLNKNISYLGYINEVTFSHGGNCLMINIQGDVPLGMKPAQIVIVHPESDTDSSYIAAGDIVLNSFVRGHTQVENIPLHPEAIAQIKKIYKLYTGLDFVKKFNSEQDLNKFTWGSIFPLFS